jgi:hypothetical protein
MKGGTAGQNTLVVNDSAARSVEKAGNFDIFLCRNMSYYVVVARRDHTLSSQKKMELPKTVHDAAAVADSLAPPAFKTLVDAVFATLLDPKTSIAPVFGMV